MCSCQGSVPPDAPGYVAPLAKARGSVGMEVRAKAEAHQKATPETPKNLPLLFQELVPTHRKGTGKEHQVVEKEEEKGKGVGEKGEEKGKGVGEKGEEKGKGVGEKGDEKGKGVGEKGDEKGKGMGEKGEEKGVGTRTDVGREDPRPRPKAKGKALEDAMVPGMGKGKPQDPRPKARKANVDETWPVEEIPEQKGKGKDYMPTESKGANKGLEEPRGKGYESGKAEPESEPTEEARQSKGEWKGRGKSEDEVPGLTENEIWEAAFRKGMAKGRDQERARPSRRSHSRRHHTDSDRDRRRRKTEHDR